MANKKQKKGLMNVLFILVFVIMFSMIISPYKVSYPSEGNQYSGTGLGGLYQQFDTSKYCKEGNDFVFQVKPFSCTPKVVRSDLLEEQDVPVFCTISATQLNPLLDVKEIETLNFKGEYPRGVKTIGFQPERAALGYENDLNTPIMEDIGSAVIVLRREPNESAMPDYVEGNITAQIRYNAENAFGIGKTEFYLPSMSDSDWNEKQEYYSFWDGKGYLRATNIRSDKARISIYSDKYKTKSSSNYLEKIESFGQTLNAGEKSGRIYLPGFNPCMANLQVKLVSIENPSTTARLKVNSEIIEIKQGEKFLNEKCRIVNVEKQGLLQYVTLDCEEDEDGFLEKNNFELFFSPKIDMNVNGQNGTYEIGDKLYDSTMDGEEGGVFLGYVGVKGDKILGDIDKEDLFAVLVFYPEEKEKLSRTEITQVSRLVDDIGTYSDAKGMNEFERVWDGIKKVSGNIRKVGGNFISGRQIQVIPFSQDGKREFSFKEKDISIINFAGARNKEFSDEASNEDVQNFEEYYENSIEDYNTLINGYPGEDYSRNMKYKEKAMRDKIKLAFNTEQKRDLKEMCKKFEQEYPNNEIPSECGSDYLFSNSRTSTKDVLIDGRVRSISFGGIYEPSYEEFGAEIMIENKSGFRKSYKLRKDQKIFLDDEGKDYIKLEELDKEKREAEIEVSLEKKGEVDEDENEFVSGDKKLKIGDSKTFLSDYEFILRDINLEKVALVRLDPNIDYSKSTADFNFRVGIEKRALQLSPEKTKQRLEDVNKTIKQLEEISGYLDDTTKAMKGACLATKGYLTVKSFINNAKGKGEARNIVMRGAGGWNEKCLRAAEREGSEYDSQEECLNANADKIDAQVERYTQIMNNQDENLKQLQNAHMTENKLLGESFVDTEEFANDYSKRVSSSLEGVNENYFEQNDIDKENIQNVLNNEDSWKTKQYTIQELKQIERYSQALKQDPEDPVAKKELASVLKDVEVNSKKFLEKEDFSERTGMGRNSRVLEEEDLDEKIVLEEDVQFDNTKYSNYKFEDIENEEDKISTNENIYAIRKGNEEYIVSYDSD
ncbi:MAG TPA: hypothetical protein VJ912_00840, partial [Candidatus Nanoarchaeia archaeon]|nr:hypothetical protein [Candidatus Nanoarchaeia archaeon]